MKWSVEGLKSLQLKYARKFQEASLDFKQIRVIAGLDAAYSGEFIVACCFCKDIETGEERASFSAGKAGFPYLPGFFAFREGPWVISALLKAKLKPQLLFVDGNGTLHPRRAGLAVYVGVKANLPTIGFTKNPFYLKEKKCQGKDSGFIFLKGEIAGIWVCREGVKKPVFLSPGNLITFQDCLKAYWLFSKSRIPEPLRKAHQLARKKLQELVYT